MNPDVVIGITIPIGTALTILAILFYRYKSNEQKLATLVKIVELGGDVDPKMFQMLGSSGGGYKQDYKVGMIWIAIGGPSVAGLLVSQNYQGAVLALVFIFVGIAYIVSGKYRLREPD